MSQCRKGHHHHHSTADIWTKIAAVGEGTASLISDAYWLGGLIDLAFQLEDDGYGLSWYGAGVGTALAIITAAGSAYAHAILNINHQHQSKQDHPLTEDHRKTLPQEMDEEASSPLIPQPEDDAMTESDPSLSWLQKAALLGDFISHTGDMAGPITFIVDIAAKDRLPLWGKAIAQGGATLFGAFSSVANVRTCRKGMLLSNEQKLGYR